MDVTQSGRQGNAISFLLSVLCFHQIYHMITRGIKISYELCIYVAVCELMWVVWALRYGPSLVES
jgi:hypothetical protein